MKPMGEARAHYWMTLKMANAVGAPLDVALHDGRLGQDDYADMITRCRHCPQPTRCKAMLTNGAVGDTPPDFCTNRTELLMLRDKAV